MVGVRFLDSNLTSVSISGLSQPLTLTLPRSSRHRNPYTPQTADMDLPAVPPGESDLVTHNVTLTNVTSGVHIRLVPVSSGAVFVIYWRQGALVTEETFDGSARISVEEEYSLTITTAGVQEGGLLSLGVQIGRSTFYY